jgi:integrase/recombinase XerD
MGKKTSGPASMAKTAKSIFDIAEEGPVKAYLNSLATEGQAAMESGLRAIARLTSGDSSWTDRKRKRKLDAFPWHELRGHNISKLTQQLTTEYKPNTTRRMLSALSQLLPLVRKSMPPDEYLDVMEALRKAPKRLPNDDADPRGRALSDAEALRLIVTAQEHSNKLKGARDAALIAVMYGAGLRRIEASRALRTDYSEDGEGGREKQIRVIGKRRKVRYVPLVKTFADHVDRWVIARETHAITGLQLFVQISSGKALSTDVISDVIEAVRKRAGIAEFTPHDLRRSFGTHLLDRGVDIALVKELMGHVDIQTTTIYDKRGGEAKRRAVKVLEPDKEPS